MKSLRYFFSLVALVVTPVLSIGQTTVTMNRHAVDADKFIKTQFARHRVPPFSFRYNGKSSDNNKQLLQLRCGGLGIAFSQHRQP